MRKGDCTGEAAHCPPLSIITVCLNERERIERTCESIVRQTFQDFEWIVLDGVSTDGSLEILQRYRQRMDYFVSEKDRGIYHAMNKGIQQAKGAYLFFLNGGDYFYQTDVLAKVFGTRLEKDVYYGDIMLEELDRHKKRSVDFRHAYRMFTRRTLPHQATFIKRDLFRRYGNYDEAFRIAADLDLFLRVFVSNPARKKHSIGYLPYIISWHEHSLGVSSNTQFADAREKENRSIRKKHYPNFYLTFWQKAYLLYKDYARLISKAKGFLKSILLQY